MSVSTPAREVKIRYGDRVLDSGSGGTYDHLDPYTGELSVRIPLAGKDEVDDAVRVAREVAEEWRRWTPEARRDVLFTLADLIEQNRQEFAELAVLDIGTPIVAASWIIDMALAWTRYYAGWCDKLSGELISSLDTRGEFSYTQPQPYGVVGIIITWNGPMLSLGMKVPAALAAGNCVVIKPSEFTPYAADLYARLALEAGIPAGVLSMLPGSLEAGDALVRHPDIELISFTGGPGAAKSILVSCAEQMKPAVLELGGKSANIVFPDAEDIELVCQRAVAAVMTGTSGQSCAAPTRLIVHEDIYDQVVERVAEIAKSYKVGNPWEEDTAVGPVVNKAAAQRIVGMLERARADNAGRFIAGGGQASGELEGKNFIEPTVIADVDLDHEISQVEVFGPVLLVNKFVDEDDAVEIANRTVYGLAAYIETSNLKRAHRMAERLKAGSVSINGAFVLRPHMPYGGFGISGYGKEGGRAGIDEYLRYKTVTIS